MIISEGRTVTALQRRYALPALAVLGAVLAYHQPQPPDSDVDGSWRYTLAAAAALHLVFGRDLAYTYGPLGWIGAPIAGAYHQIALELALACIAAACGIALAVLAATARSLLRAAATISLAGSVFAFNGAVVPAIPPEYQLTVITLIAVTLVPPTGRLAPLAFALSGCCAGIALAIRPATAAVISVCSIASLIPIALNERGRALRLAAFALTACVLTSIVTLIDPLRHGVLAAYLLQSFEIARGYPAAMSVAGSAPEGRAALAAFAGGIALITLCAWERHGRIAAAGSVVLVAAWKHTTVRQGLEHAPYLYTSVMLIAAIAIAIATSRKLAIMATVIGFAACIHLITLDIVSHRQQLPSIQAAIIADPATYWSGRTIDALPNDSVTAILSSGIYRPLPVFQLFAAYTPQLDALDASRLREFGADTILYRFTSIDNRYPLADAPLVMRELICRYVARGERFTKDGRRFVELRRARNRCIEQKSWLVSRINDPLALPHITANQFLIAEINLLPTISGRARGLIGQIQAPTMIFQLASGKMFRRSFVAATAADGVVVRPYADGQRDVEALFNGTSQHDEASLSIDPGPDYSITSIRITIIARTSN